MMIEKSQNEGTNKVIMRQLKNQVGGLSLYIGITRELGIDKSETNGNNNP